jgi:hypothetical protein
MPHSGPAAAPDGGRARQRARAADGHSAVPPAARSYGAAVAPVRAQVGVQVPLTVGEHGVIPSGCGGRDGGPRAGAGGAVRRRGEGGVDLEGVVLDHVRPRASVYAVHRALPSSQFWSRTAHSSQLCEWST